MLTEAKVELKTEPNGVAAWLMQIDRVVNAAVGQFELVHIVDRPEYFPVPQAAEYCRHVIIWDDHIVPVMDIVSWLTGNTQSEDPGIVAILVYKNERDIFSYGGIKLENTPVMERVNNSQQCEMHGDSDRLKSVSISCFRSSAGDVVPVLDVAGLFSQSIKAENLSL